MPQRFPPTTSTKDLGRVNCFLVIFLCLKVFLVVVFSLLILARKLLKGPGSMRRSWFQLAVLLSPHRLPGLLFFKGLLKSKLLASQTSTWPQVSLLSRISLPCGFLHLLLFLALDCFYLFMNTAKWVEGACNIYLNYQVFSSLLVHLYARNAIHLFPHPLRPPSPLHTPLFIPEQRWHSSASLYSALFGGLCTCCFCIFIYFKISFLKPTEKERVKLGFRNEILKL